MTGASISEKDGTPPTSAYHQCLVGLRLKKKRLYGLLITTNYMIRGSSRLLLACVQVFDLASGHVMAQVRARTMMRFG